MDRSGVGGRICTAPSRPTSLNFGFAAILWLAWLLVHLGPQNRESIHTTFKRRFHKVLQRQGEI